MKNADVKVGRKYYAMVSGKMAIVQIDRWLAPISTGWMATNTATKKAIRIRSAARLRGEYSPNHQTMNSSLVYQPGDTVRIRTADGSAHHARVISLLREITIPRTNVYRVELLPDAQPETNRDMENPK